jgi:uncharacterized membrane protein (DUF4010 family)
MSNWRCHRIQSVDLQPQSVLGICISTLGGAAIGVERQYSGHAHGPHSHFAGLRTFTLLGALAGTSAHLWTSGIEVPASILLAGAVALILAAYLAASRRDVDATTEVAALIVLAAGFLAGLGSWTLASALIATTSVLLIEKSRLHSFVENLPDLGLRAGFRFALMALVILPLLPEGPYGPLGGIRPRELWIIVLLISGLSFTGYAARLIVGPSHGYVVTGILGGLISSTNVTYTLARISATEPTSATPLAIGVITACTVMYLRVAVVTAMLNPKLGLALIPYWLIPALAGTAISILGLRSHDKSIESGPIPGNPLALGSALQMATLFQLVLFAITAIQRYWGQSGLIFSGAILGLTDVDALTISMTKSAQNPENIPIAATAIAVGCLANSLFKLGIALALGRGAFRARVAAGFLALIVAAMASFGWGIWF